MKPLTYFCACPQAEAIEALNWTDGLTDQEKAIVARLAVDGFNFSKMCEFININPNRKALVYAEDFERVNFFASPVADIVFGGRDNIAKAADGMPVEFCRGAIDYFNQF